MKPLHICLENAVDVVSHERRKLIEGEARKWANAGLPMRKRWREPSTYWHGVVIQHERLVWRDAYTRRLARLMRVAS